MEHFCFPEPYFLHFTEKSWVTRNSLRPLDTTFYSCTDLGLFGFRTECSFWSLLSGEKVSGKNPLWAGRGKPCYSPRCLSISQPLCCSISYTLALIMLQNPLRNLIQPSFLLTTEQFQAGSRWLRKGKSEKTHTRCSPYKYYHAGVWRGISSST